MSLAVNRDAQVNVFSAPYRHVVIHDFLSDALADQLQQGFERTITKAKPIGKVGEVGELHYAAINYTPDTIDFATTAVSVFASECVEQFVAGLLGVDVNRAFMLGSHRHLPPSKNGWAHTDCAIVSFPTQNPRFNGFDLFQPDSGCVYADDSRDRQPDSIKMARAIACIYYVGNREWHPDDGGETAIYDHDGKTLVKRVPPIHNSLLAFEISPVSYHGYLGSQSKVRDSYIWWYHTGIECVTHRHADAFEFRRQQQQDPWDRWTDESVPKFEVLTTPDPATTGNPA